MTKNKALVFLSTLLAFILLSSFSAQAGVVLIDETGGKTWISKGKLKNLPQSEEEEWTIADFSEGRITMVNPKEKKAYTGTVQEYCRFMEQMVNQMTQAMGQFLGMTDLKKDKQRAIDVTVQKSGSEKIAGFSTRKYKIFADGKLYEELWISKDSSLTREMGDMKYMDQFNECSAGEGMAEVENAPAYRKLMHSGWILRQVSYEDGDRDVLEDIVSAERKSIPDSMFQVPSGYEILSFSEISQMVETEMSELQMEENDEEEAPADEDVMQLKGFMQKGMDNMKKGIEGLKLPWGKD